jgi:hypothetical protein
MILLKTFLCIILNLSLISSFLFFIYLSLLLSDDTIIVFYIIISLIDICTLFIIKHRIKWIIQCINTNTLLSPFSNGSYLILYFIYFSLILSLLISNSNYHHPLLIACLISEGVTFLSINIYAYIHLNNINSVKKRINVKLKDYSSSNLININQNIDSCSICLEVLNNETQLKITDCNHIFHTLCITKWVESVTINSNEVKCPNCRTELV